MLVRVDTSSTVPIFEQIEREVREAIQRGDLKVGDRLPAARDLADGLGVNMHTVLRAYQVLRDHGVVDLRRGRGAVVAKGAFDHSNVRLALDAFVQAARAVGLGPAETLELVRKEMQQ